MKKCLFFLMVLFTAVSFAGADLIAHYSMEETSGAIVDQVGGETAEPVDAGQVYSVPGPDSWGDAVGLTGNGAWQLDATESAELNDLLNNFTVAAWVKLDSGLLAAKTGVNANNNRIIGDDVAWDGDAWSFGVRGGNLIFTKNGVVDVLTSVAVPVDQWVHVAAVVSSTAGVEFYLDGVLAQTVANTANNNAGNDVFGIGRSYGNAEAQWFAGSLDEVRVYNTVMAETEVAELLVSGNTAELVSPGNGAATIPVDEPLKWSAPTVLVPDSYTLSLRIGDANWLDTANVSVTNGATSPFTAGWDRDTTYFWRVDSVKAGETYIGSTWSFTTVLSVPEFAPGLPEGVFTEAVQDVVYTVTATNPFTLDDTGMTYKWLKAPAAALTEGAKYQGTTTDTLTVTSVDVADEGEYFCRVTITSNSASADSAMANLDIKRLVGHWPFDGDLVDVVGGNDGSVGDPNFAEGIVGTQQAADFFGDDPVTLPTTALQTAAWSISWWDFSGPDAGGPGVWEVMVGSGEGPSGYEDFEFCRERAYRYVFGFDAGGGEYKWTPDDAEVYPRGQWHFHAVAFDDETDVVSWYIDGVLFHDFINRSVSLDEVLYLGNVRGMDEPFTGRIDDFKLYNYPLNATEAAIEYTNTVDVVICTGDIVGDFNGDCKVNADDLVKLAEAWLDCNMIPLCL